VSRKPTVSRLPVLGLPIILIAALLTPAAVFGQVTPAAKPAPAAATPQPPKVDPILAGLAAGDKAQQQQAVATITGLFDSKPADAARLFRDLWLGAMLKARLHAQVLSLAPRAIVLLAADCGGLEQIQKAKVRCLNCRGCCSG
jgi:hypothetical protein